MPECRLSIGTKAMVMAEWRNPSLFNSTTSSAAWTESQKHRPTKNFAISAAFSYQWCFERTLHPSLPLLSPQPDPCYWWLTKERCAAETLVSSEGKCKWQWDGKWGGLWEISEHSLWNAFKLLDIIAKEKRGDQKLRKWLRGGERNPYTWPSRRLGLPQTASSLHFLPPLYRSHPTASLHSVCFISGLEMQDCSEEASA